MGGCQQHGNSKANGNNDEAVKQALSKIKHKFLVMSGKGGVGKTSVAVNLSMSLAEKGYKVGLMDVDIHGPDVPRMLGLTGIKAGSKGEKLEPMRYSDNLSAISIEGILPDNDTAVIWRGPLKHAAITQFISEVNWGDLDYLIIDSPPGTGDEPMSVAQTVPDARAIVVTTPQEVALSDVRKSINFCKKLNMEIFGVVENMSGYACPHCGGGIDPFGTGGGEKTAKQFGIKFLGRIPFDPNMVKSADIGDAFQLSYKDSPVTKALNDIADLLAAG
jgi:ATP-binding protein involved in chromosome partitioning